MTFFFLFLLMKLIFVLEDRDEFPCQLVLILVLVRKSSIPKGFHEWHMGCPVAQL